VLAFVDGGRIWYDEMPGSWRTGYGAGVWAALAGRAVVTATYDASDEGGAFALRLGFAL
jgi:hypothetical protein